MNKIKLFFIILVCSLCATQVSSQLFKKARNGIGKSYFSVDYALFKSEEADKTARLEIYYQIFNAALNFEKIDKTFEAEYEITIDLFKNKKRYDIFKHSQIVRVDNESKVSSRSDYRTNQVNFSLEEGKYEIIVRLYDPVHSKERIEKFNVKIENFKNKKTIVSDIELIQGIATAIDSISVFNKGDLQLIPSVRHKFGMSGKNSLYFYMELYQGNDMLKDVRVETVLRHESKGMMYRDSLTTTFNNPIERQFRELSIEELRPGKYELIITLRGERNNKIDTKYKDFEIAWTPQALIRYDYDKLVHQIEIIATNEEIELLKDIEIYEDRLKAFTEFWDKQDPTPGTFENETKNEFYRRVSVSNYNFSTMFENGWNTDRGRIYIMYGEPDQLDDFPVVPDQRPYQEWYYYQNSKYLKFVFVDFNEDGDYRLVYPSDGLYKRE